MKKGSIKKSAQSPKGATKPQAKDDVLKVYGCFFTPQMRTVCTLLEMNSIRFDSFDVNIFEESMQAIKSSKPKETRSDPSAVPESPVGFNQPVLYEGGRTIMGDAPTIYRYLCMTKRPQQIS